MSKVQVQNAKTARQVQSELVMAWAQDVATGEPRYILELGEDRRGASCACVCVGCGQPLTAVNVAKERFVLRPHFRHPAGVEHPDCLILAARAAAVRQLQANGWLELPRRRMSARATGLSGEYYDAWAERPAEKLRITDVGYRDRAAAIFTFEDGRQLRVELTGSPLRDATGEGAASIEIVVDDPEVAAMDPQEIRQRLTLVPDPLCWRSHWADLQLMADARAAAQDLAVLHLDELPPELELPEGMDPRLKRETVLHYEAKRVLQLEGRLSVPACEIQVAVRDADGDPLSANWGAEADVLKLDHIELEAQYESIVPDVSCKAYPLDGGRVFAPMLIEITVTNTIDEQRLQRIAAMRCAALEIDLSLLGGRVNRDEFRRLVIDEVAHKRWLYHPIAEEQRAALLSELQLQVQQEKARRARAQERRAAVLAMPLSDIAKEYLQAVEALAREYARRDGLKLPTPPAEMFPFHERLADAVDKFTIRGYPEAGDYDLIGWAGIVPRLLSIQQDQGVGYRLATGRAVLNAIHSDRNGDARSDHTLFLIAARVYQPKLTTEQRQWLDAWAEEVRDSIKSRESTFLRDPRYDRLIALLFPEMAEALAKPFGKRGVFVPPQRPKPGVRKPACTICRLSCTTSRGLTARPAPSRTRTKATSG